METGLKTPLRTQTTLPFLKALFSLESPGKAALIAFFCATYLKPEMHHIYRQISLLDSFSRLVITQKLENPECFPFDPLVVLPRSSWRWWGRFWERSVSGRPWQISSKEVLRLMELLTSRNASILHIFFGTTAIHYLPILRLSHIPVVVSFHGADVAGIMLSPHYREALLELFEKASLLTCRSSHLASRLVSLGCPPKKVRLQHTVLPELPFSRHFFPQDGPWKILQINRLIAKKGLRTSLQAFALFAREHPASLTIAGEGPMREELIELSHQLNISHQVRWIGFQTQEALQNLLANHSIFLHPSESTAEGDTEGIPNALLEALASGIPCIATRHGGIPEAIENGVDGLLVDEQQPEQLAESMYLLARDPELYERLSLRGAENVRKKFGQETVIRELTDCYQSLLP